MALPWLVAGGIAVVAIAALVLRTIGWLRSWFGGTLLALMVPAPLISVGSPPPVHYGITDSLPTITTYTIPILGLLVVGVLAHRSAIALGIVAATLAYTALLAVLAWPGSLLNWAGVAFLVTGACAFAAGSGLMGSESVGPRIRAWAPVAVLITMIGQLVLCVLQLLGIPASLHPEVEYFMTEGRALGSFNHPSVLGKFGLLLLVILLPATESTQKSQRRSAWAGIALCIVLSGMTQARANTLAIVGAVILWLLMQSSARLSRKRKAWSIAAVAVVSVPALLLAMKRFLVDSSGGERGHFLAVGMPFVRDNLWFGMGSNSYVEVVGAVDPLTAQGFPIHNAFLLFIAELGVVGALIAFAPLFVTVGLAIRLVRAPADPGRHARAVVATLPGVLLVAATGWGLVSTSNYVTWYLVLGLAFGAMNAGSTPFRARAADNEQAGRLREPSAFPAPSRQGTERG